MKGAKKEAATPKKKAPPPPKDVEESSEEDSEEEEEVSCNLYYNLPATCILPCSLRYNVLLALNKLYCTCRRHHLKLLKRQLQLRQ